MNVDPSLAVTVDPSPPVIATVEIGVALPPLLVEVLVGLRVGPVETPLGKIWGEDAAELPLCFGLITVK
jgi:hypothetical protein